MRSQIMLLTVVIQVPYVNNKLYNYRALLDSARLNFISSNLCKMVGLNTGEVKINLSGISESCHHIARTVHLKLKSRYNFFISKINCLSIQKITTICF